MARKARIHKNAHYDTLPPMELRAPEFRTKELIEKNRIDTPLTPIGLVDRDNLMRNIAQLTLSQTYKWPSAFNDDHHLFWPSKDYTSNDTSLINPQYFRNLAINRIDWQRAFHGWAHLVSLPPKKPGEEVMYYTCEAQSSIDAMHQSVRLLKMLFRNPRVTTQRFENRANEITDQYHIAHSRLVELPSEFHFIKPNMVQIKGIEDMIMMNGELGRLATRATVATATRIIHQHKPELVHI